MKIGIMGGTFDPLHNGHVMLAQYAYRMFALDEVWFLPNGMPPHKSKATIESLTKHRVEMIQAAISQYSYFKLCLYETRHKQISYSYQTMEYFKEQFPQNEFYFIIGADSLFAIEHWKYPQRLLSTCTVLAACRDDKGTEDMQHQIFYLNQKYQAEIKLLRTPGISISSHEIRHRIKKGLSIADYVPKEVEEYIEEQNLFKDDEYGPAKSKPN